MSIESRSRSSMFSMLFVNFSRVYWASQMHSSSVLSFIKEPYEDVSYAGQSYGRVPGVKLGYLKLLVCLCSIAWGNMGHCVDGHIGEVGVDAVGEGEYDTVGGKRLFEVLDQCPDELKGVHGNVELEQKLEPAPFSLL